LVTLLLKRFYMEDIMERQDLKEIIHRIIKKVQEEADKDAPQPACIFNDNCDGGPTTMYAVGEEN